MIPPKIYGLIGYPVKHSLSPKMHSAAFKERAIDAEYRLFELRSEELEGFLNAESLRKKNIWGFNITVPYKTWLVKNTVKETTVRTNLLVTLAGAINTVKREDKKLICYNTDIQGFIESLGKDLKFATNGKNALVFGCGGVGRAVIAGLTQKGTGVNKVYMYDVNKETAALTKKHFGQFREAGDKLEFILEEQKIPGKIKDSDLLINASTVGMKEGDGSIIDKNLLHKNLYVYDVIYNRKTQLIKDAESLGLNAKNGLGMLLYQGAAAFEIWTGQKAPVEVMREALEDEVGDYDA